MNCVNCKTINLEGSQFCNKCGMNLTNYAMNKNTSTQVSDILLLMFVGVALVASIAQFIIQRFFIDWYYSSVRYVQGLIWIIQNISYILIPLSIKNIPIKIAGFIITAIWIVYWLISNVQFLLR